jgi:hypothetical protein
MPSWSEQPFTVPTINVNSRATHAHPNRSDPRFCDSDCAPVLVPCPIPRSFTAEVRLGRHTCGVAATFGQHAPECPARPVKVSCYTRGATWADAELAGVLSDGDSMDAMRDDAAWTSCRARWEIVKALVTGKACDCGRSRIVNGGWEHALACGIRSIPAALLQQRDAVFAALARTATMEAGVFSAQDDAMRAFLKPIDGFKPDWAMEEKLARRVSASILERYVERLVEQVGVLS